MAKLPVNLDLFDILLEYIREAMRGDVDISRPLRKASPLLTFCENFYAQFFQNEFGLRITSVDTSAKRLSVRLRRRIREEGVSKEVLLLVTWFERLCDIYADVLALLYDFEQAEIAWEFHDEYMVTLLERILNWAKQQDYSGIERRSLVLLNRWKKMLDELE